MADPLRRTGPYEADHVGDFEDEVYLRKRIADHYDPWEGEARLLASLDDARHRAASETERADFLERGREVARAEVARLRSLVDSHEAVLRALHERVEREARWAAERPEDD